MRHVIKVMMVFMVLGAMACKKSEPAAPVVTPPTDTTTTPPNTDIPNNAGDGVTFINSGKSAIFNLYAPGKVSVGVIGDFNNWTATAMKRTTDGTRWWVQVDNLDPNTEYAYQFLINGTLRVADPYTQKVLDPNNDQYISPSIYPGLKAYPTGKTTEIVGTMQYNQPAYSWKVNNFVKPAKKDLVIYELLVRDFVADHSYKTVIDTLDYLQRLGVNAIELMPVTEFEGNESWGYNVSFFFAPDKYYGTKNDLKAFVDECHQRGIAVIMDMVLNHAFGSSSMVRMYFDQSTQKPSSNSPWFNVDATHPFNVGYDFNHESAATKYFAKNVMKFWLSEYKIDGYRFDLSKGFTQRNNPTNVEAWGAYDASRVAIWKDYNATIKATDPTAYVILEHFAADQEEVELAADGMMPWNNLAYGAQEATMGWAATMDMSRLLFTKHGFTKPENMVSYIESHDEERLMFKDINYANASGSYNGKDLTTATQRNAMTAAFLMSTPGPKLIWQFGELGYDISIDQNGRTGNKPVLWSYQNIPARKALYNAYAKYISMKLKNPVFSSSTVTADLTGVIKTVAITSATADVEVIGNFDMVAKPATINFTKTGTWYDYVTGGTINVTNTATTATLNPGEYHIYSSVKLQ